MKHIEKLLIDENGINDELMILYSEVKIDIDEDKSVNFPKKYIFAKDVVIRENDFECFFKYENESSWDYTATNSSSGAYGLCQALPPEKMESAGDDWKINPITQLK